MDFKFALELAKREAKKDKLELEEAVEIMENAVKNCWFVWITGHEALRVLKENLNNERQGNLS